MDKSLLLNACIALTQSDLGRSASDWARAQAVRQFNALLYRAQELYPSRPDISAMEGYPNAEVVYSRDLIDAAQRLRTAVELHRPGSISDVVDSIELPPDSREALAGDLEELRDAIALGLKKTALLLSGSMAEAMLLARHPDKSERGPGLLPLVEQAKKERLFGRDTLRHLESLNDYRDLIHTRAGPRNRIEITDVRVQHALQALKLLCSELEDTKVKYGQ
jgi:hypothetical protein